MKRLIALALLLGCAHFEIAPRSTLRVTRLHCDARVTPRFSWVLESSERDDRQTAYRIAVTHDAEVMWDSGRVDSSETLHIPYRGKPLEPGQRIGWTLRVWDRNGAESEPASGFWETGLREWNAKWITNRKTDGPAPLFRREFKVGKKVSRARAYVTGLGYYELRLNGEKVGDQVLDPGWTTYWKRVLYSTYDVTAMLREGANAIGAVVGNGWYNPLPLRMWGWLNIREHLTVGAPRLIVRLEIEYEDGTRQSVVTDETWRVGEGPILKNSLYLGEVYDARREQAGWDRAGFDDATWAPAVLEKESIGPLHPQHAPPIRVTRTIQPVNLAEPKPGVFLFDFGQNFAGWARLRVKGDAGTSVTMRYGELLHPDGTLNAMTSVCGQIKGGDVAFQTDTYILKGGGEETYTPRFTFRGFRYVEVTGSPGRPSLEGLRLNSDVASVGSFSCSNERFNRIHEMCRWTILSNLFSVQSDCPHREKFGYGGDIVAASEFAIFNFDMSAFYAKAVEDLADAARANGGMTETAPYVGIADEGLGGQSGPVGWGTAYPLLQAQLYQYYGDRRILEEHYDATKRWVEFVRSKAKGHILDNGISDHESLVPKPRALTGTAFYHLNVRLMARIARALGRDEDAEAYSKLAVEIRDAFNRRFAKGGRYDTATQCCQAFALYHDLVPEADRREAMETLVADVKAKNLTTGIFGTKYMLSVLPAEVAFEVVNRKEFPGWGHMLERGATTLWEHWEFSDNIYSHNHPMFGSVDEWFYRVPGGINPDPDAVGFDRIVIRPQVVGDLTWVKARYESCRGTVACEWRLEGGTLTLDVTIPVGATATVHVPGGEVHRVGSGSHRFRGGR